jgi:hypothetical protein
MLTPLETPIARKYLYVKMIVETNEHIRIVITKSAKKK